LQPTMSRASSLATSIDEYITPFLSPLNGKRTPLQHRLETGKPYHNPICCQIARQLKKTPL
jgi:hypothetical protein